MREYIEKRSLARISMNQQVSFCCRTTDYYSGTIVNISEIGMFIVTQVCFPIDSELNLLMLSNEMLKVNVNVRWLRKYADYFDGIGVMIQNPSKKYLDFVTILRPI